MKCGDEFYKWQSIHDDALVKCLKCGGKLVRVIDRVQTYGVGERGAATRFHDLREERWTVDGAAYKRLRHEGHQPPSVDGSADLERDARSPFEIETGLRFGHMDQTLVEESTQMARESGWDPKVHAKRAAESV